MERWSELLTWSRCLAGLHLALMSTIPRPWHTWKKRALLLCRKRDMCKIVQIVQRQVDWVETFAVVLAWCFCSASDLRQSLGMYWTNRRCRLQRISSGNIWSSLPTQSAETTLLRDSAFRNWFGIRDPKEWKVEKVHEWINGIWLPRWQKHNWPGQDDNGIINSGGIGQSDCASVLWQSSAIASMTSCMAGAWFTWGIHVVCSNAATSHASFCSCVER